MKQLLKFHIEMYNVRTNNVLTIHDDVNLVQGITIRKDLQLNNQAQVSFFKSKAYALIGTEQYLKLYNYVKIELTTIERDSLDSLEQEKIYYFSGFITAVDKQNTYGQNPRSSIIITISDFSSLFKTTFFTQNLKFLDILNMSIPELRLMNFNDVFFNGVEGKLIDKFYNPNEMGFIFFAFLYFKFLYKIVVDAEGKQKTTTGANPTPIFKQFKVFMPFCLEEKSMFYNQASSLMIYKQFQGPAWDLFKYLYPEPVFEFNTYETKDAVVLMIRPVPYCSFRRNVKSIIAAKTPKTSQKETVEIVFSPDSYDIIDKNDFGFLNIKDKGYSNVLDLIINTNSNVIKIITSADIMKNKMIKLEDLLPSPDETKKIIDDFYNVKRFDIRRVESTNLSKSANSVVNLIYTVPVTATAIIQTSGQALIWANYNKRLENDSFESVLQAQFSPGFPDSNPVFLWNYKDIFKDQFVSGDINYFGLREFEIKWNFLNMFDMSAGLILSNISSQLREDIIESLQNKKDAITKGKNIKNDSKLADSKTTVSTIDGKTISEHLGSDLYKSSLVQYTKPRMKAAYKSKESKSKITFINDALKDPEFIALLKRVKLDPSNVSKSTIIETIKNLGEISDRSLSNTANIINDIIAKSYRENEHLYSGQINTVIDTSILPGQIIESNHPISKYNKPYFKGYVEGITHLIDFNAASFKTSISVNRLASDDSEVVKKI